MKKIVSISFLFLLTGSMTFAQKSKHYCGIHGATEEVYQMYPELRQHAQEYQEAQLLLLNSMNSAQNIEKGAALYTIPVVFHVLHEYGTERIDESQIYDVMRVLNEEYNAKDPDSVDVIPEFQNLIGNGRIEFKLAAIDPQGNCTNGIHYINSHETRIGDAYSKIQQWDRSKYLNIWVVKVVGQPGAAAYALKPPSTDGNGFWMDGIVSNHTYVGSIGTSSPFNESTISHEIAHYLNVSHVWGSTNQPEVACGDDGVADTPVTRGHNPGNCPLTLAAQKATGMMCDTTIVEDVQNYMDYSYCDRHFTPGQISVMHNALNGIAGQRNVIWQDSTLIATGVKDLLLPQDPTDPLTVPLCTPIADFQLPSFSVCEGANVTFKDFSSNAVIDSWEWTFQDGSPATSTSQNPTVSFTSPGWKTVTLKATNSAGTGEISKQIYVRGNWADFNGPKQLDMEDDYVNWFQQNNIENNHAKFQVVNSGGYNNSKCFKLNIWKDITGAPLFTNDYFYYDRLGLSKDELLTPSFDLRYTTNVTVKFKYSYATNATTSQQLTETLKVYSSKDCGETWQLRKTILPSQIVTGGFAGSSDYVPTTNAQWTEVSFPYNTSSSDDKVMFKIVFEASDYSSNLYVDDFFVDGTLSLTNEVISMMDLNVYPNPVANGTGINISYMGQNTDVTFTVRNAQGKVVTTETVKATNTQVTRELTGTNNLASGCYFVEVNVNGNRTVRKVVVL